MAEREHMVLSGQLTEPKHPGGRPSKYDSSFVDAVIDFMAQGFSLTAFAGSIEVNVDTCHEWRKVHPEFSDAVKIGQAKRVMKLEGDLYQAKDSPTVTSRIFALKNAGPEEWSDKHKVEHSGVDGVPLVPVLNVIYERTANDQPEAPSQAVNGTQYNGH